MELNQQDMVNDSPLMKSFTFSAWLVAGFTPISRGSKLDYYINRPEGMKGYILHLTLRGEGRIRAGCRDIASRENDLFLFPPGVAHHYGRAEHHEYWDHLWIYFLPRPYWLDWLRWDQVINGIGITSLPLGQPSEQAQRLFLEVIQQNGRSGLLAEALAMNALERLIIDCFQRQPLCSHQTIEPRISTLCQYLNDHLAEDLTIEQLARQVFLSPSRVAHLFKREMKMTIFAWREQQRVIRASNLLQSTHLSIAQVALTVGYDDALYFSRIFRQHVGVSPREYKKRYELLPV
ncbi:arabinose operon transcriptional regulator AraC [Erwinia rhapontici]|uniref:arabinose operon transcriptional regulator AraC n=1 Tax=Erwinia rhapontici TaxID=55212 RepID=UPI00106201AF|nr:arabinose operon transcriptional regulator AraC [Erwinia rhapontici]MBP2153995.1 AraC family transcriptional regulator of arabinose operon [Erwinia rhapontici]TDS99369.1 AraC family transcriptional regulator of arabinose operon [Erwinia rhapontici]